MSTTGTQQMKNNLETVTTYKMTTAEQLKQKMQESLLIKNAVRNLMILRTIQLFEAHGYKVNDNKRTSDGPIRVWKGFNSLPVQLEEELKQDGIELVCEEYERSGLFDDYYTVYIYYIKQAK